VEKRKKGLAAAHIVVNSIHLACHLLSIVTFTPVTPRCSPPDVAIPANLAIFAMARSLVNYSRSPMVVK